MYESFAERNKTHYNRIKDFNLYKKGLSSSKIAVLRNCSIRTIEKHRSNIITKLDLPPTQNALLHWLYNNSSIFNTTSNLNKLLNILIFEEID